MRRATLEDLARDPVGRFTAGETFAHFCAHAGLWGIVLWGRPDDAHAKQLGASLVLELAPPAKPHASIVDASRLEGGSERAFRALERYVVRYAPLLAAYVTKLAVVRSRGLGGAIVAGAHEVLPLPYPAAVFDDVRAALAWLGERAPDDRAAQIAALYDEANGTSAELTALRALLDANLRGMPLAAAAKSLGTSERTLQRKLGDAGTAFQLETTLARVRAAKRMLAESDAPLTTIALECGCASLQHFNALFRKREGIAPGAWRKRERAR
jgi:AraC-like DNA-binding protein